MEPADKQCAPEAARQGQKAGLPATKNQEAEPTAQQATCATAAQQLAGSASTAAAAEPAPASASAPGGCSAASGVQRAKISNHTSKCKPITTSDSQGRKVASSGRSRKAAQVGVKRNRGTADAAGIQHLQHCSPTDATPTFSGSLTPAHGNNPGAVTLPTPHHRPRSSRLLAFAAAVGGTEVRPAQTVMEVRAPHCLGEKCFHLLRCSLPSLRFLHAALLVKLSSCSSSVHTHITFTGFLSLCAATAIASFPLNISADCACLVCTPRIYCSCNGQRSRHCGTARRCHSGTADTGLFVAWPYVPCHHVLFCTALRCKQAQERGELVQMQDDASYAMDGLNSTCSIEAQRDSAVILAEMLSTRKGRVALR